MKFESKYGLGEICLVNMQEAQPNMERMLPELMVKVLAVTFEVDGRWFYTVEHIDNNRKIGRFTMPETEMTGDPDYDQETGGYPDEA